MNLSAEKKEDESPATKAFNWKLWQTWWRFSKLLSLEMLEVLWRCLGGKDLLWCWSTEDDDCGELVLTLHSWKRKTNFCEWRRSPTRNESFEPRRKSLQNPSVPSRRRTRWNSSVPSGSLGSRLSLASLAPSLIYSSRWVVWRTKEGRSSFFS